MPIRQKVLGMKKSQGQLDNGTAYDSTKVYIETRFADSPNTKGFAVAEYKLGTSAEFDKFKHLPFPFFAEVEYDMVTNGKSQQTVIVSLTPAAVDKASAPASRAGA